MWRIAKNNKLHIKNWKNDAIVFHEGPDDTHLVDLHTASILELLNSQSLTSEKDMVNHLTTEYKKAFQNDDVCAILRTLKSLKLVEEISETG